MIRRFLNIAKFQKLKDNLVDRFGIKTPQILRNLEYFKNYVEWQNIMKWEWFILQQTQKPEDRVLLILEHL